MPDKFNAKTMPHKAMAVRPTQQVTIVKGGRYLAKTSTKKRAAPKDGQTETEHINLIKKKTAPKERF